MIQSLPRACVIPAGILTRVIYMRTLHHSRRERECERKRLFGTRYSITGGSRRRSSHASHARVAGAWTVGILTSQPRESLEGVGCKLAIEDYYDERFLQVLINIVVILYYCIITIRVCLEPLIKAEPPHPTSSFPLQMLEFR